jgi:hypothetical protein
MKKQYLLLLTPLISLCMESPEIDSKKAHQEKFSNCLSDLTHKEEKEKHPTSVIPSKDQVIHWKFSCGHSVQYNPKDTNPDKLSEKIKTGNRTVTHKIETRIIKPDGDTEASTTEFKSRQSTVTAECPECGEKIHNARLVHAKELSSDRAKYRQEKAAIDKQKEQSGAAPKKGWW